MGPWPHELGKYEAEGFTEHLNSKDPKIKFPIKPAYD